MNVKESHIVTGMSRDSAVSRHNPNLVYDAHNIRITTRDGNNSLLSVTNEKGTKQVTITGDIITGTPLGSAAIGDYVIIFTHQDTAPKDNIYRCTITSSGATIKTIFTGDAGFSLNNPIEALPVYETEEIQKVYWVDGLNQPRMINIILTTPLTNADLLNFSREVQLSHTLSVKKSATGGEFPPGTIQYCFSYFMKNGQETRLIDVSPMYYLSPKEKGTAADSVDHSSFNITINNVDKSFDYVRLYAILRTSENATPNCRIVGDYVIDNSGDITINDNGVYGSSIEPASLYFIGGEELVAGTLAQKDNTLFLGNLELKKPTLEKFLGSPTLNGISVYYDSLNAVGGTLPTRSNNYYDYNPDNNRSSYYIKRFKYKETYKLGFIAQYKNGQWSEPMFIGNKVNDHTPVASSSNYHTGGFKASFSATDVAALRKLGFRRIAPVVVYPNVIGRRVIAQGLASATVATYNDRESNSPFAQSSWFFRLCDGSITDKKALPSNGNSKGEVQCMDTYMTTGYDHDPNYDTEGSKNTNYFFINTKILTVNSPEVECANDFDSIDLHNTTCNVVGRALLQGNAYRVVDHYLTVENAGINADSSHTIQVSRKLSNSHVRSFCLYCDSMVNSGNTEEVSAVDKDKLYGWVVYPWQRSGSLNNQAALTTKQKSAGFTARTAMLKRNVTANAMFANSVYDRDFSFDMGGYVPEVFSADQLAGVRLSGGGDSFIYYGNVDKVVTAEDNFYYAKFGWDRATKQTDETDPNKKKSATELSNDCVTNPPIYWSDRKSVGDDQGTKVSDPISMKYKSTPHIVMCCPAGATLSNDGTWSGLYIVEFVRNNVTDIDKFGSSADATNLNWIRCGESVELSGAVDINYLQGDCYFQRYDCLKTYPFTNEDTNSVIELFSTTLETYVNLDFRTDKNRGGGNNTALLHTNFNLYNHASYEQSGNFFTHHGLDYSRLSKSVFPNAITWSLEKHFGEDVDNWTSIDASNVLEVDGALGKLNRLINYNNDVYAFQDIGFSQLLFNSRVQIPASDGVPIEITNGMKMQGKRYISTKIGCTNKWSIIETPSGLYFNDDILRTTYLFNGQLQDLSTTKGMKSWMNEHCAQEVWNPSTFNNCRAFYDKVGKDVYWIYGDTALVYSEVLGQYMSFMDYGGVPLIENAGNSTFATLSVTNTIPTGGQTAECFVKCEPQSQGDFIFTSGIVNKPMSLTVHIKEPNDQGLCPAAQSVINVGDSIITIDVTIYSSNLDEMDHEFRKWTISEILTKLNTDLYGYFIVTVGNGDIALTDVLATYHDHWLSIDYGPFSFDASSGGSSIITSPFWELGTGAYNMFFGQYKPYWITFISNSYPTENKIFNNVAWRDIVTAGSTPKPFHTFDHIRVWTAIQDTQSVRFSNSLSENQSRQPISYNAAMSNLRKKFNVWRCQIPRDKLATNSGRARISNPWCYIKLSREDAQTERLELLDVEVDYFK